MKKYLIALLSIVLLTPWVGSAPPMEAAQSPPVSSDSTSEALKQRAMDVYLNMPLYFVANQGQVDESVGYYAQGGGHSLYFTAEEVVMALEETTLRMRFVGANATSPVGAEQAAAKVNYFIGSDPAQWQTDVPTYGQVVYHNLYPGVDLRYGGQAGALKYTFVVQPGADVSQIRLAYGGAAGLRLDEAGNLLILAGGRELKDARPYAYQEIGGRRVEVETEFVLHGVRTYGFAVQSAYDPRHPLVIDPVLITLLYSTYLGGSGFDEGKSIAVDGAGNVYVTGRTSSTDFPTKNAYQGDQGDADAFVTKIDPAQSGAASLLYSTYLGGSNMDEGNSITVDESGHAYVTGDTLSTNFPTKNAYQSNQAAGTDAFVAKLNAAGNALLYSTYLVGSGYDYSYDIAVDGFGNAYVTGSTRSTDFPTQKPYQGTHGGIYDAFVAKIDTTQSGHASLVYSTYLGGSEWDEGYGIALDGAGNAYVAGNTRSTDFPTQNPYQGTCGGCPTYFDAFVTKIDTTQSGAASLVYSTYLGGSGSDYGSGIALDGAGNAYVTGSTGSTDFPTQNTYHDSLGGSSVDAFVTKIDTTQSGAASLVYSTYLGGSEWDEGYGIAVDGTGNAYVTGGTLSTDFPTQNPYQGTCSSCLNHAFDVFVTKFNTAGSALIYSTYLGGSGYDRGFGIAVDGAGHAYVTGYAYSTDFPTQNPFQGTYGGGWSDAFVARLAELPEAVYLPAIMKSYAPFR